MISQTVRRWSIVHTWSCLICRLLLLMLAVTGLPRICHLEFDQL
ncbi:PepSY domain-containing protein, partial [Pseudomonas syringae pv. tagetis]